ncbi:MAG: NAD(P)/FAD-dependent oxidoreductase [Proteobacteria bacterium]|nr:NAD(P)/FAD-dependent oxidoreductase [Pseudomonadota bacterium]
MCAFTAARRGRRVLVLEKSNKIGKKILMSGGGRCNFTNLYVAPENFISNNPHFCKSALNRYTQWDFIAMVENHGIEYEERKHGQLFCLHSARDILDMLLKECELAGVELRMHCEVGQILVDQHEWPYQLDISRGKGIDKASIKLKCKSLVIATGALSIPSLGGSSLGYEIADQFGLSVTERRAGLVPFMFSDSLKPVCERLSGLATEIEVSCNGQSFTESMLFTHRGMSGPAILQISNYWRPGDELSIKLLPGVDAENWLAGLKNTQGRGLLKNLLHQKLAKAFVNELQILWWPEYQDTPIAEIPDKALASIGESLNHWKLKPSASEGYRTAEVTLGGIDTDGVSSKTMESKDRPGLYFVGEVLDVTGHLGGFNFQWAWSSGYTAGLYA